MTDWIAIAAVALACVVLVWRWISMLDGDSAASNPQAKLRVTQHRGNPLRDHCPDLRALSQQPMSPQLKAEFDAFAGEYGEALDKLARHKQKPSQRKARKCK